MNFINIGMEFDDGKRTWNLEEIIVALHFHNIDFIAIEQQHPEGGEPTAVVSVTDDPLDFSVRMLCLTLRQDCVALWGSTEPGRLTGPNSEKWGPFDPKLFLLPKVVESHIISKLA
jgi:hypothetical protein